MAIRWFKKNYLVLLLLSVFVLVLYLPFLGNAFLSDDLPEIQNNPAIRSFNYVINHPPGYIRPLVYFLTINLFGLNPIFFRLFNFLLHLGNVWLIYALISLLHKKRLAIIISTIFAVHPILVEPVIWISGGTYPQFSFFILSSLISYILHSRKGGFIYYSLSLISFLFSLQSHMIAMTLPAIIFIYELSYDNIKANWKKLIPYALMSLFWLILSYSFVPERTQTLQSVHYQESSIENPIKLAPIAISEYLKLIFWPQDLTLYHSELNFSTLQFIWRVVISTALFVLIIFSYLKSKIIFFWLSFFIINLVPTIITATFKLTWIVAERYAYLSSLGIIAALTLSINSLLEHKKYKSVAYIFIVALILSLSARTVSRNIDWINEDNLWIATGKTSPSSPNTHNNLGDMYGRHKNYPVAIKEFETAILLKPDYADAYHNLGNTYNEIGEKTKALELYKRAAELNPILWQSHQNIAALYFEQQKYEEAIEQLQKAIQISPNNLNLHMNLGIVYLKQGDKEKAKQIFSQILQAFPNYQPALQGLAEASK